MTKNDHRSILIIGESDLKSGKSLLINTLANYFFNGSISDNIVCKVSSNLFNINQQESKYEFIKDSYAFTFYDTPTIYQADNLTVSIPQYDINSGLKDNNYIKNNYGGFIYNKEIEPKLISIVKTAINTDLGGLIFIIKNQDQIDMIKKITSLYNSLKFYLPARLMNSCALVISNCLKMNCSLPSEYLLQFPNIFYLQNELFNTDPLNWDNDSQSLLKLQLKLSFNTIEKVLKLFKDNEPYSMASLNNTLSLFSKKHFKIHYNKSLLITLNEYENIIQNQNYKLTHNIYGTKDSECIICRNCKKVCFNQFNDIYKNYFQCTVCKCLPTHHHFSKKEYGCFQSKEYDNLFGQMEEKYLNNEEKRNFVNKRINRLFSLISEKLIRKLHHFKLKCAALDQIDELESIMNIIKSSNHFIKRKKIYYKIESEIQDLKNDSKTETKQIHFNLKMSEE